MRLYEKNLIAIDIKKNFFLKCTRLILGPGKANRLLNYLFHFINSSFILSYTTEIDLCKTTFNTKEKKDYSHPNYPDYYFPDFQKISNKPYRLIKYCTVRISPIYIYITPLNKITSHYTSLKFHLFHQPLPQILISPAYKIPSPVPTSTYRGEIE